MSYLLIGLWACLGAPSTDEEYRFELDTSPWVQMWYASTVDSGKLDEAGTFHPEPRFIGMNQHGFRVGPGKAINLPFRDPVYEYRSGALIYGRIDGWGQFVPDVGGHIIAFKDYRYVPGKSRRIYNLPGRFVKVEAQKPDR